MFDPQELPVPDLGLMCKECGYPLAGLSKHVCPECGQSFNLDQFIPKGDCPPLIADGKEVRATPDVVELLRLYQIPYVQLNDIGSSLFGARMLDRPKSGPRIGVPREFYLEVIDLIRRDGQGEPMPEMPAAALREHPWECASCGESNPPNFEICWQCGEPVPEGAM